MQSETEAGISTGYYIPACKVKETWDNGRTVNPTNLEGEIITHYIFEELFNAGSIGSRWLTHLELETLYRKHNVLDATGKVAMQVQLLG